MPVTHPAGDHRRPPLADLVVALAGTLFVLAGAAGLVPALSGVALAVAGGCALACVRLAWLAGAPPTTAGPDAPAPDPTRRAEGDLVPAGQHGPNPPVARDPARPARARTGRQVRRAALTRRVATILDAAVLAAGLTVAVLPLTDPAHRLPVALAGLAVAAPLYAVALLRLPGRSRLTGAERLRRAVDVLGLGLSLVFAGWVLLPPGEVPSVARTASVAGATGLAVLLVAALANRRRRPGAARCQAGAAATLAGLALLVVLLAYRAPDRAVLGVAPLLLVGALLTASGARRSAAGERPRPGGFPVAWPGLTAPAGIAALAAGHHLWTVGEFTGTAVALGLAVIPPMVLRELLTAADQRRRVARLAAREARLRDLVGDDRPAGPASTMAPVDRAGLLRELARRTGGALLVIDLHAPDGRAVEAPVLVQVTGRIRAGCGSTDLVARLADHEFAVLTDVGPVLAFALGTRLLAALGAPYPRPAGAIRLQVGVGLAETSGGDAEDVLRQADLARRRAVQLGRDRVEWYDAYLEEQLVRRLDLERELPGAVARGELDLVFQPVLALADRHPVGTEALLRWRSPVLGTVLPDELLPVAADLDLVGEVGRWVLDRACRQLAAWSGGGRELWMAVNVTPRELAAPDFVTRTATALAAYDVPPERLVVEVAEPAVGAELSTVVARLAGLRSLGVRTALDDFRAEHASLAQLRRLPIDLLKVGPHLVGPATEGQRPLIEVVANLGDRLGLEVVVEGLESEAQVAEARRAGCRYGQGFALARPATAERVEAWFEEFPAAPR
ncbi:bifunctional diguanylate cyclase/phosphodiesterase [Micromonospora sp. CB01531]|uniref:bifunctional diguanylate cyclase/phosphodiesterase n=1 Tax=Micromonospora sp. CB01531 TaxID=1718947 RepID=UPI000AEBEFB4|nr:GGDEF domain-containing protein [Micromonospora sp. CB01531]